MAILMLYSFTRVSTNGMFSWVGAHTIMGRPAALAHSNVGRKSSTDFALVMPTLPELMILIPAASYSARAARTCATASAARGWPSGGNPGRCWLAPALGGWSALRLIQGVLTALMNSIALARSNLRNV